MKKFRILPSTALNAAGLALLLVATPAVAARTSCGNSIVETGEDCDDGNLEPGDCCSPSCLWEDNGSTCETPDACLGEGVCDDGECVDGTAVVCDDENPCTTDYCDSDAGGCLARAIDGCCTEDGECEDGVVCNGFETCLVTPFAPTGACVSGTPIDCDDGDDCTRDACIPSSGGCEFTPDQHGLGCMAEDADSDAVWDRLDRCPSTPLGVSVGPDGCSPGDLAENPLLMIEDSDLALEKLERTFFAADDMARERKFVRKIRRTIESAAYALRSARSCVATKLFFKAELMNERVLISLDQRRRSAYVRAAGPVAPAPLGTPSDTHPSELLVAFFETATTRMQDASSHFIRSSDAVSTACRSAVQEKGEARVSEVDTRHGRLLLEDGRIVRMSGGGVRGPVLPGSTVVFQGERFGASDIVGRSVIATTNPKLELSPYDVTLCYELQVAPVQPEGDLDLTPILHPFAGYRPQDAPASSTAWLERGMALYVKQKCTPPASTPDASGKYTRYSADFRVQTKAAFSNTTNYANGFDKSGDDWWKLADSLSGPGTLTVRWYSRECNPANSPFPCDTPKFLKEQVYTINVNKTGGFCRAEYETTEFVLEDRDPDFDDGSLLFSQLMDDFAPARVVSMSGLNTIFGGTRSFTASAYKILGPSTTSFPDLETIGENEDFAIYAARDPFWNETEYQGVDRPAGVSFPAVIGTRNGASYRYVCTVPDLVRDKVDPCADSPDSYYRLPYEYESGNVECGQGNNSQWTHCGDNYPYECGGKYAFDFAIPDGKPVLAARGGTVIGRRSNAKNSCFDKTACDEDNFFCCIESSGGGICTGGAPAKLGNVCDADSDCDSASPGGDGACRCAANYAAVEHMDGTVGVYFHMQEGGVDVEVGDRIYRGDELGVTGTTGCSTGPHVHFETIGTAGAGSAWERASQPMRFQTTAGGTCVTPVTKGKYRSNNGPWFGAF